MFVSVILNSKSRSRVNHQGIFSHPLYDVTSIFFLLEDNQRTCLVVQDEVLSEHLSVGKLLGKVFYRVDRPCGELRKGLRRLLWVQYHDGYRMPTFTA